MTGYLKPSKEKKTMRGFDIYSNICVWGGALKIASDHWNKGVFLVSAKNAFVPVKRDKSVNTYSRISTVP